MRAAGEAVLPWPLNDGTDDQDLAGECVVELLLSIFGSVRANP